MERYIAFLRGINVSGHHKVPMVELKKRLETLGCENVITILNSGNVIFESSNTNLEQLERIISDQLESTFGLPTPTILKTSKMIDHLFLKDPF